MHVQMKGEPLEYFLGLILGLYLNSLSFLIAQLCLTIYQASGRDKGFSAESQILQGILFCFGGVFFGLFFIFPLACDPFTSFHLSFFAFCLCHQLLPFWVISLFLLGALCTIPVHYLSFPNSVFAFPNIIRLILTLLICAFLLALLTFFIQSHEESVWRSDSPERSIPRHGQKN